MARRRVAVLGYGAIGTQVCALLQAGAVRGADLVAVVRRERDADEPLTCDLDEAVRRSDIIVECAGQEAVGALAEATASRDVDLVITSIGALLVDAVLTNALGKHPGRVRLTSGAIGGFDLLRSARRAGEFDRVELTTTKRATSLVRPWMTADVLERLARDRGEPFEVFSGTAAEAAELFPESLNVAAALALAAGAQNLEVRLIADPAVSRVRHRVEAHGPTGDYTFEFVNHPSAQNPKTSAVVPYAVLEAVAELAN